jgi:hypothetical protein
MENPAVGMADSGRWERARAFVVHEFREMLPPTIFFFLGFNLILFSKRLLLADYLIEFSGFVIATTSALVVGKTVLVANMMPLMRRFDYAPLIQPVLFKTAFYTVLVSVARLMEALVHYMIAGGSLGDGGFLDDLLDRFSWNRFIAVQLWVFVLFLVYVTASELNDHFGDGELFKIFFVRPSSKLKSTRRARVRLLVQLSRLMETHPLETLSDPHTPQHTELVAILRKLGRGDSSAGGGR